MSAKRFRQLLCFLRVDNRFWQWYSEENRIIIKKHNDRGCVVHQKKAGCVQVQETAFERETRRKDAGTWGCISWA